jgi:hypothetical protein
MWRTRWHSLLRHYIRSPKVARSILDGFVVIFLWLNLPRRTSALGSTQPLNRSDYQGSFLGANAAGAQGWQRYHIHVPMFWNSDSLKLLDPWWPVQLRNGIDLLFLSFAFYYTCVGGVLRKTGPVFYDVFFFSDLVELYWQEKMDVRPWRRNLPSVTLHTTNPVT